MTEFVAIIANISLALSFVIALIFGISQVQAAARDRREKLTLETLRLFETRDFAELMHMMNTRPMPHSIAELNKMPEKERIMFTQFAQQMESLGIIVAEGLIDLDLVDKTLGNFVSNSFKKCEKLFVDIREKTDDPNTAEYYQWLATHIDERIRTNPRPAFYLQKDA